MKLLYNNKKTKPERGAVSINKYIRLSYKDRHIILPFSEKHDTPEKFSTDYLFIGLKVFGILIHLYKVRSKFWHKEKKRWFEQIAPFFYKTTLFGTPNSFRFLFNLKGAMFSPHPLPPIEVDIREFKYKWCIPIKPTYICNGLTSENNTILIKNYDEILSQR